MKKDTKTMKKFLAQLEETPVIIIACKKTNLSRATIYRWMEDTAFKKQVKNAIDEGSKLINDIAESKLIGMIENSQLSAIQYWLRHHHESYKPHQFPLWVVKK